MSHGREIVKFPAERKKKTGTQIAPRIAYQWWIPRFSSKNPILISDRRKFTRWILDLPSDIICRLSRFSNQTRLCYRQNSFVTMETDRYVKIRALFNFTVVGCWSYRRGANDIWIFIWSLPSRWSSLMDIARLNLSGKWPAPSLLFLLNF